jgi:hypothetical protein
MKGFKFYLEYESPAKKRKGEHAGTVVAAFTGDEYQFIKDGEWMRECIATLTDSPNCPWVCSVNVSDEYLRKNCKRISEQKAREIHPNLFSILEG